MKRDGSVKRFHVLKSPVEKLEGVKLTVHYSNNTFLFKNNFKACTVFNETFSEDSLFGERGDANFDNVCAPAVYVVKDV